MCFKVLKYLFTFSEVARRSIGLLEKFATLLSAISVLKIIILERFPTVGIEISSKTAVETFYFDGKNTLIAEKYVATYVCVYI